MYKNMGRIKRTVEEYMVLTLATFIMVIGIYVFKFPNNFSFGGVTGIAIVLSKFLPGTPGNITLIINMVLLVLGFLFLGKGFGIKTAYVSILMSVSLNLAEVWFPMEKPLTSEPVLELIYAIVLPAFSSAIFFNIDASSGGTDIVAMILKKYTKLNIGTALFFSDLLIVLASCFVFDTKTGLFSLTGLLAKSLVVDNVIESINLCKYFTIICEELGLFGAFCVILLFVMLLWRMMVIANNAPDLFGALLVVGVMGHFAIQVVLNIAVVTNSIPNTGITLPFISYGGTSILFLMSEIGLVLNVSKSIRLRDVG